MAYERNRRPISAITDMVITDMVGGEVLTRKEWEADIDRLVVTGIVITDIVITDIVVTDKVSVATIPPS